MAGLAGVGLERVLDTIRGVLQRDLPLLQHEKSYTENKLKKELLASFKKKGTKQCTSLDKSGVRKHAMESNEHGGFRCVNCKDLGPN